MPPRTGFVPDFNRRTALTGLSGAVLASVVLSLQGSALAQQSPPEIVAPGSTPPQPGAIVAPSKLDARSYRTDTLTVGTFAKETSMLALTHAQHPKVRQFAQFEADEQTAIAQALTNQANPAPMPLDSQRQAMLAKLGAATGRSFDTQYIAGQIDGHRQLLQLQEAFLITDSGNRDLDHIAILARSVITMHLTMLSDLQQSLAS